MKTLFLILFVLFTSNLMSKNIVGSFKGWKGDTTVKLNDGSIWIQDERIRTICSILNPNVELEIIAGSYKMKVLGCGDNWIKVKQVKKQKIYNSNKKSKVIN